MNWAFAQKDVKAVLKMAKKRKAYMVEPKDKIKWFKQAELTFSNDNSIMEFSYDLLQEDSETTEDAELISIFTKLLVTMGKKEQALSYVTSARERVKDARTKSYLKNMIRYVESSM